ncbi:hypothetical protein GOV12_07145 [Candidatus Pacearchaeota archaeon]|nr:hypothetical protein [Candidatus Pacearchaeota archaeon]
MYIENQDESKNPKFWIQDYWNEWVFQGLNLAALEYGDMGVGIDVIRKNEVKTFLEYIEHHGYDSQLCDLDMIPLEFIDKTNRLVRLYNKYINEEPIILSKLEIIVSMARRVIYSH